MKKTIIFTAALAVAALVSCSKELTPNDNTDPVQNKAKGFPVSIELGVPELGGDEETKITGTPVSNAGSLKSYSFQWEKGDSITLFAYDSATVSADNIMKCGTLYAQSSGKQVTFSGELDAALYDHPTWTKLYAMANAISQDFTIAADTKGNRYKIVGAVISDRQDGTGFQNSIFSATDWKLDYDGETPEIKVNGNMSLTNSVVFLDLSDLNESYEIDSLKMLVDYHGTTSSFTGGWGDNIQLATNSVGINSGGNKTYVTVSNGSVLPDTVLVSMRRTLPGSSGLAHVYMYFYYRDKGSSEEKMTIKRMALYDGVNNLQIKDQKITPLAKFSKEKFVAETDSITFTISKTCKITGLDTSKNFYYFPYSDYENSDYFMKGKGGATMTSDELKAFFVNQAGVDRQFVFINDTTKSTKDTLVVGMVGNYATVSIAYSYFLKKTESLFLGSTYIGIPLKPGKQLVRIKIIATGGTSNYYSNLFLRTNKTSTDSKYLVDPLTPFLNMDNPVDWSLWCPKSDVQQCYLAITQGRKVKLKSFAFYYQ